MLLQLKQLVHKARNHAGFRRYASNTSWMFAEQLLRMAAGLLVGIWVARYLGPSQFGLFSYAIAFTSLFGSMAKMGLDSIVVRELVRTPELRDVYLGTAFWLKLMGAVVMLAVMAVAVQFTSNDATTNLYIFIIGSGTLFQSFEVVDFYFQSKVLSKFVSICKLTQLFISSLIKLYLIYIKAELFWFVLVSLVDQITLAISLFLAYQHQKLRLFFNAFNTATAKKLMHDSWPLVLSSLVVMVYMRTDQIMIKEMLGEYELGLYSAAVRLSEIWYFIPATMTLSILPFFINAKKNNNDIYLLRLQNFVTITTWIAIIIATTMTFASDALVIMLYGHQYKEAGVVLAIHMWGCVFVFLGIAAGSFFTIENYTKKTLLRMLLGAIFNALANLLLIPLYGIIGAAVATVTSQLIANFLVDFFDRDVKTILRIKVKALFPLYIFLKKI